MEQHTTREQLTRHDPAQGKRSWLMIIGCSLPVVALVVLPLLGVSWGTALVFLLVLACPLMHLLGMHGGHHQPGSQDGPNSKKEGV